MRNIVLAFLLALAIGANAQTVGQVDSRIPQIPLSECDSLVRADLAGHYAIVYKDGLCGVYDIRRAENVTRIEYSWLSAGVREEYEDDYYTTFIVFYAGSHGMLGVSELDNEFICILYPYGEDKE